MKKGDKITVYSDDRPSEKHEITIANVSIEQYEFDTWVEVVDENDNHWQFLNTNKKDNKIMKPVSMTDNKLYEIRLIVAIPDYSDGTSDLDYSLDLIIPSLDSEITVLQMDSTPLSLVEKAPK